MLVYPECGGVFPDFVYTAVDYRPCLVKGAHKSGLGFASCSRKRAAVDDRAKQKRDQQNEYVGKQK
jgi:hypothetical protein